MYKSPISDLINEALLIFLSGVRGIAFGRTTRDILHFSLIFMFRFTPYTGKVNNTKETCNVKSRGMIYRVVKLSSAQNRFKELKKEIMVRSHCEVSWVSPPVKVLKTDQIFSTYATLFVQFAITVMRVNRSLWANNQMRQNEVLLTEIC